MTESSDWSQQADRPVFPRRGPTPPAGGDGNPYFTDPVDRAYHYAGALLDYAGQYRDTTGQTPSGPDLAELADRAGSDAQGTGWAGHPLVTGAAEDSSREVAMDPTPLAPPNGGGTTAPQDQQSGMAGGSGQAPTPTPTPSPAHGTFDPDTFADTITRIELPGPKKKCATHVRQAFEAAGGDSAGHPNDAKDWGPTLERNDLAPVDPTNYQP